MKKMFRIIGAMGFLPAKLLGMGIAEIAWIVTAISALLKLLAELLAKKPTGNESKLPPLPDDVKTK